MKPQNRSYSIHLLLLVLCLNACTSLGCASPRVLVVQAHAYDIDVRLDPNHNTLEGSTTLELALAGEPDVIAEHETPAIDIQLHPDLRITEVAHNRRLLRHQRLPMAKADGEFQPRTHRVRLERLPTPDDEPIRLTVHYQGKLYQDVAAGEKPGEIHNFDMRAHIGTEGIYLAGGYWYPEPVRPQGVSPRLADFVLTVRSVRGIELVAGAERDLVANKETSRLTWVSPYPLDGMVLVGGPHEVHESLHGDTILRLHLKPSQAEQADGLMAAVAGYLDRYEPLIGPYPAREFAIVDNFFSSGFAFPTFTLLSSAVINMGKRAQTAHGYIDHEVLHCWWGNGIHVDPEDGNWCESLASYGANYYGHVLDGNEDEARRKRRNYAHFLSRLKPKSDKPLGTFGRENGCSRAIAYNKGAAVFHMLARKIGQDALWSAMRRFTHDYVGRYADWDDIRRLCEEESGKDLMRFFRQWVRSGGAPMLTIESATYDSAGSKLTLAISQGEPAFDLSVPVRVTHAGGAVDVKVSLSAPTDDVTIPVDYVPLTVEADPDFHIFRRVPAGDIIPTTATTRKADAFATILPQGEVHEQFAAVQGIFEESFEGNERTVAVAGNVHEKLPGERSLLILGNAVDDAVVAEFLRSIEFPITWTDSGFVFDGLEYNEPSQAFLCTVKHPSLDRGGITIIYANSAEATPRGFTIPFYDRSLIIFDDDMPTLRHDFEPRHIVEVVRP